MKIVGLTGGIGSGKSTVAAIFEELGVPVFYADVVAKELYNDPNILAQVAEILEAPDLANRFDKARMASIIFNDEAKRKKINAFIHPLVKLRFNDWMKNQSGAYCLREAAILIESGSYRDCDAVIVVACSVDKRIARVMQRDNLPKTEVENRIKAQMPDEERMQYAQFIIRNDGDQADLKQQVFNIHIQLSA